MTAKKGRALALELMDDLLEDDTQGSEGKQEKGSKADESKPPSEASAKKTPRAARERSSSKASVRQKEPLKPTSNVKDDDDFSPTIRRARKAGDEDSQKKFLDYDFSHIERERAEADVPVSDTSGQDFNSDEDHTYKLSESKIIGTPDLSGVSLPGEIDKTEVLHKSDSNFSNQGRGEDHVRASVGRFASLRSSGAVSPAEAALAQSENLRIAQDRILELEKEMERLRLENEELAAAGETLRRRADELWAESETAEARYSELKSSSEEERQMLQDTIHNRDSQLEQLNLKNEELEMRLSTNIQKIRVRERELENRLELVKMESAALVRNKDEIILDLKRQVDQLNMELDNYRHKGQELNKQLGEKQDMLRRTVKALRIALSMLEGSGEVQSGQKKAK